jgi:hypothetical protein
VTDGSVERRRTAATEEEAVRVGSRRPRRRWAVALWMSERRATAGAERRRLVDLPAGVVAPGHVRECRLHVIPRDHKHSQVVACSHGSREAGCRWIACIPSMV